MATKKKHRIYKKKKKDGTRARKPGRRIDLDNIYEKSILAKKAGRPRVCYPYEQCRDMIRLEGISSVSQYADWWQLNHPRGIPKRPDRAYKNSGWVTWNEFLGTDNKFSGVQKTFLPYIQAKKLAQSLKLTGWMDWLALKNRPEGLPARPDLIYARSDEWEGWREFLGKHATSKLNTLEHNDKIIYILKDIRKTNGLYYIGLYEGTPINFKEMVVSKPHLHHVKSYHLDNNKLNWKDIILQYASKYDYEGNDSEYLCQNIYALIERMGHTLPEVLYQ